MTHQFKTRGFEVLKEFELQVDELPSRATGKSSGYDIRAVGNYRVKPNEMAPVATGLTAYMLDDEELQLRARSGLAYNKQITLQNGIGTIDSDYYGKHIMVLVRNEGKEDFIIKHGERVCQGVFAKYLTTDGDETTTEREGGLGSTGVE
jgi:dUTP pyrophosphatase